jgi:hypothetical protein
MSRNESRWLMTPPPAYAPSQARSGHLPFADSAKGRNDTLEVIVDADADQIVARSLIAAGQQ